jgi:hypothetical protein
VPIWPAPRTPNRFIPCAMDIVVDWKARAEITCKMCDAPACDSGRSCDAPERVTCLELLSTQISTQHFKASHSKQRSSFPSRPREASKMVGTANDIFVILPSYANRKSQR